MKEPKEKKKKTQKQSSSVPDISGYKVDTYNESAHTHITRTIASYNESTGPPDMTLTTFT